jgi:YgiT-type zinc finger domain-containing protein
MMRCERCDQGERRPVRRAKLAQRDGRVAVVLDVPMEECPACAEHWLEWDVARRLDVLLNDMLASDVEVAMRHFPASDAPAA